jgi:hypothetical protein
MRVSVTRTQNEELGSVVRVEKASEPSADEVLAHRSRLAAGVYLDVELAGPCCWHALVFRSAETSRPVVDWILGSRTVDAADATSTGTASIDLWDVVPGLRVAVVDALDRWLQLPLDQPLVDAERAVSRWRMVERMPAGPARGGVVGDALTLARQASQGLAAYLHNRAEDVVVPDLQTALEALVDGYEELAGEVEEPDAELTAVLQARARFSERMARRSQPRTRTRSPVAATPAPATPLVGPRRSVIDPRQSPARTFTLSADPAVAEVTVAAAEEPGALTVRAPAFSAGITSDLLARLMVRLVDRSSGAQVSHAVLTTTSRSPRPDGPAILEASVPLLGFDPASVRADLFDILAVGAPTTDDDDAALHSVRRAVNLLGEWRRVLGLTRMTVRPGDSLTALRRSVRRLQDTVRDADPHVPICAGAPTPDELGSLASSGDEELLSRLSAREASGPWSEVHRLTVAELAAAEASLL